MKEKIASLLGRGLSVTAVADAVGCDHSYISQLMSDEEFHAKVTELRAANQVRYVEADESLDAAEAVALSKVTSLLPFVTKASEAARIFSMLNGAKRKATDVGNQQQAPAQTVVLNLPASMQVAITLSQQKQVIDIDGRSMATLPARALADRLEQRRTQQLLETSVPATLPIGQQSELAKAL